MAETNVLSPQHERCLINCDTYRKYYWYRMLFEQKKCPLCERPVAIYPELYKNNHWTVLNNLLTNPSHRLETLIIVFNEHVHGLDWNSIYALADLESVYLWIERTFSKTLSEYGGMIHSRLGDAEHSIDTVPNHYHQTFIIPDGTGDVLVPVFKGSRRQQEIRERAIQFGEQYEAGEIPE